MSGSSHLSGVIAICGLALLLVSIWVKKWLQIVQLRQSQWRFSNPVARRASRLRLQTLLDETDAEHGGGARSKESIMWSRRAASTALVPAFGSAISSVIFFVVSSGDISTKSPHVKPVNLWIFMLVFFFSIGLHTVFENTLAHQLIEILLGSRLRQSSKHMFDGILLMLAGGRGLSKPATILLSGLDIVWMYVITTASFPLFCSYQHSPPILPSHPEITCWDNTTHWALVALSAGSLYGVFSWSLSMVLRKCKWPSHEYWHKFEGLFEKTNADGQIIDKLMLKTNTGSDGEDLVVARKMAKRPASGFDEWGSKEFIFEVIEPVEGDAFQMLFKPDLSGTPSQSQLTNPLLETQADILRVELRDNDVGQRGSLHVVHCDAAPVGRLHRLGGEWRRSGFLTVPHLESPLACFGVTVIKVVATLTWSAYVPPHIKESWRLVTTGILIACALSIAAVTHWYRPCAFDIVNNVTVLGMVSAAVMSMVSLAHTTLLPPSHWTILAETWIVNLLIVAAVVLISVLSVVFVFEDAQFVRDIESNFQVHIIEQATKYMPHLGVVPFWSVQLGKDAIERSLDLKEWSEGHQNLKSLYGDGKEPCQIILEDLGPVRIIEVCDGRLAKSESVAYQTWAQDPDNQKDIMSRIVGSTNIKNAPLAPSPVPETQRVRVIRESHPWPSLEALLQQASSRNKPDMKDARFLDLKTDGQRLQDIEEQFPRALPLGMCGDGKSSLMAALSGLSRTNRTIEIRDGPQKKGVTQDTTAVFDGRRLLIDMPGVQDGMKSVALQFLALTKNKLSGYPADDEVIPKEFHKRLFLNHFLLVVSATQTRFSKMHEAMQLLSMHFGPTLTEMMTVVFTNAGQVTSVEQQTHVIDSFQHEFSEVFPNAPPLALLQSMSDFEEGHIACIFIDTHAALPDCEWKFSSEARIAARQALKRIEARIDSSKSKQLPTCYWPPVVEYCAGTELVHEQNKELGETLRPIQAYNGLPLNFDWTWELLDKPEGLSVGRNGRLEGRVSKPGCYDLRLMTKAPDDKQPAGFERPMSLRSSCVVRLQIGHSHKCLRKQLIELVGKDVNEVSTTLGSSKVPDLREAAALLNKSIEAGGKVSEKNVDEVVRKVIESRRETNERVSGVMKIMRLKEDEHKNELELERKSSEAKLQASQQAAEHQRMELQAKLQASEEQQEARERKSIEMERERLKEEHKKELELERKAAEAKLQASDEAAERQKKELQAMLQSSEEHREAAERKSIEMEKELDMANKTRKGNGVAFRIQNAGTATINGEYVPGYGEIDGKQWYEKIRDVHNPGGGSVYSYAGKYWFASTDAAKKEKVLYYVQSDAKQPPAQGWIKDQGAHPEPSFRSANLRLL